MLRLPDAHATAMFAIDDVQDDIILCDRCYTNSMEYPQFADFITAFRQRAATARETLVALNADSETVDTNPVGMTGMVRV